MILQNMLIFWFGALNAFVLCIAVMAVRAISDKKLRLNFLMLMLATALWINLVLSLQVPEIVPETGKWLIRFIFASGVFFFLATSLFAFRFAGVAEKARSLPHLIFVLNHGLVLGLIFTDYGIAGAHRESYGIAPEYGSFHLYIVASFILYGIYIFTVVGLAYRNSDNDILRFQIKLLSFAGLGTFIITAITNGVLPLLFGTSRYSAVSSLAMLFFLSGILVIVARGTRRFLHSEFDRVVSNSSVKSGQNFTAVREFIEAMRFALEEQAPAFQRQIAFSRTDGSQIALTLQGGDAQAPALAEAPAMTPRMVEGLMDTALRLDYDNKHLALALLRAESELQEKWLSDLSGKIAERDTLPAPVEIRIADQLVEIMKHMENNEETYGVAFCAFSPVMVKLMRQADACAQSDRSVLISGETGTGRKLLARAIHYRRTGNKSLVQIACADQDINSLQKNIHATLATSPAGILLTDIDTIPAEFLYVINELFEATQKKTQLYFTMHSDYEAALPDIPRKTFAYLDQLKLTTPPLRKRRDDIVPLLVLAASVAAQASNRDFRFISADSANQALTHSWPGNITDLQNTVHRAMLENKAPLVASLRLDSTLSLSGEESLLSPLEKAERRVISEYLRKNNYNKNRTRIELDITVNTLNAKIIKYGIKGSRALLE